MADELLLSSLELLRRLGARPVVNAAVLGSARLGIDSLRLRYAWQAMLDRDPLAGLDPADSLPMIDVLVPAHPKDLRTLPYAVAAAPHGTANPIRRVALVVPDAAVDEIARNVPRHCQVQPEGELLGELQPWLREQVPPQWRGWVLQQCLKLLWVMRNDVPTLVLDADTILLTPRIWALSDGRQLLCVSAERHAEYVRHASSCWELTSAAQAVSYVTHHQLMQPEVVRTMFPDGLASIQRWIEQADFSRPSALSEYHCYGAWLRTHQPDRVVLGRFGNRGRDGGELDELARTHGIAETLQELTARYPERLSLSFHSWRADS